MKTMTFSTRLLTAGIIATGLLASQAAFADFVDCPGTLSQDDREFTLETTPGATCLAYGPDSNDNINGNNDAINQLGYVTLDKSDDTTTGLFDGALTGTSDGLSGILTTGLNGTFTINSALVSGYTNLVIAFKSGFGQLTPTWAAFSLPATVFTGNWSISSTNELSHANLYGKVGGGGGGDPVVPIPAALWMVGAALFGVAGFGRKKASQSDNMISA